MSDNNTNLASGTIFDDAGYDEMQKAENHEIGFKLFKRMFFVVTIFALILVMVCSDIESVAGTAISLALTAVVLGFYLLYAYMTAKRGIMNPKFAKSWSGTWIIVFHGIMLAAWCARLIGDIQSGCELYDIALYIGWLMISTEAVLMCLCAKKNNKVLKKQLEEDEEE
ncbi:MAG: hypothetical protein IJ035_05630 [Oscillospiraceae bacterium]|nr:hypothetical protein [Oscillospiraceae bacterium]